jgi:FeS assembly SUF system protein
MNDDARIAAEPGAPPFTADDDAPGDNGEFVVPHHVRQAPPEDPPRDPETMEGWAVEALRTVFDPEIPVNIYDIGLIYHIDADAAGGTVKVWMTLTSPMCPVAETMPGMVERAVRMAVPGAREVEVEVVWEPPWTPEMMTEAARLELGMM